MLAVLTVVVTVAINMFGGKAAPPAGAQREWVNPQAEAIAALQSAGFTRRTSAQAGSTVEAGHVIGTEPGANSSVGAGDEITLNVSAGAEHSQVLDLLVPHLPDAAAQAQGGRLREPQASRPRRQRPSSRTIIGNSPSANEVRRSDHGRDHRSSSAPVRTTRSPGRRRARPPTPADKILRRRGSRTIAPVSRWTVRTRRRKRSARIHRRAQKFRWIR